MTASARGDVVIVGGGIVGMVTAYYLAKAGVPSVVIERDAIGSHASGYAYGGLSPVSGFGIPGPLAEVSQEGMRLHRELAESVVEETGIGIDFRVRSSLALAFTEADVQRLQSALPWQQRCGSGFWGGQRPSLAHYVTGMGPMDGATAAGGRSCCLSSRRCPQSFEAVEKVGAPWRHWVSGEDVTRVRLIAGCVRLDFFLALSLLRSSSSVEQVAHGR